jgi:class 3 adenylate cyclase
LPSSCFFASFDSFSGWNAFCHPRGRGDNQWVIKLPGGTISLLFTDVEGSTQLQHRLGDRYQDVVAEHRRLLEETFAQHGGAVVDRQTESFFVVFARARDAVAAAAAGQRATRPPPWPHFETGS